MNDFQPVTLYKLDGVLAKSQLATSQEDYDALVADGWVVDLTAVSTAVEEAQ